MQANASSPAPSPFLVVQSQTEGYQGRGGRALVNRLAPMGEARSRAGSYALRLLVLAAVIVAGAVIASVAGNDSVPLTHPSLASSKVTPDVPSPVFLASVAGEGERTSTFTEPALVPEKHAEEGAAAEASATAEVLDPFDAEVSIILDPEWQEKAFKRRLYPGDVKGRSSAERRAAAWEDPAVREAYARLQERYVLRDYGWNLYGRECQRFFNEAKSQPSFDQVVGAAIRKWIRDNGTPELRQRIASMEEWVYEQLFERGHTGRVSTGLVSVDDTETSALIRGPGHEIHEWALRGLPYFRDAQDVIYAALGLKAPQ